MPAIQTKALKKYYGKSRGVESVDLCIEKGEIYGFIGPNGAGKSTTIRTLLGFIIPTSGSAELLGRPCKDKELAKIKHKVGYLPSEVNLYGNMKVIDFLKYSAKYYGDHAIKRIDMLTEYFELEKGRPINSLSFGNKKKVGIVQCLLHDPELLILDEPTGGLDPLMQNKFFDFLKEENNRGKTIFFSSHVLSEVQKICQRVGIIRDGEVICEETMEELHKKQYKRVTLEVEDPEKTNIALDGVEKITKDGAKISFIYRGGANALINELNKYTIIDMAIEEPDLEEVFMHFYIKEEAK